jgi:hypothetical protein
MEELATIARQLNANAQAARIKKLLLYATAGNWENDGAQLAVLKVEPMLMQLRQLYPTTQQLRFYLYTIVANLTKPQEYQRVVNQILLECQTLYTSVDPDDVEEPTAFFSSQPPSPQVDKAMLEQQCTIAQQMELSFDRARIVKILTCVVHDRWEADPEKLAQTSISATINEVWQRYSDITELERALVSIVQRLSKAVEYGGVATQILYDLAPLYGVELEPIEGIQASLPLVAAIDGFDLRLELMKFTNPLRSKILIYSALYQQFEFDEAAWSALKRHSLDALLKKLLESYPSDAIVETLQQTAANLPDAEEYEACVAVLVRSLKLAAPKPVLSAAIGQNSSLPLPSNDDDDVTAIKLSPVIVKL